MVDFSNMPVARSWDELPPAVADTPRMLVVGSFDASAEARSTRTPGISVLIPMYQAGAYAAEAIESVLSQPEATELIVVDDGSEDDSAKHAWRALQDAQIPAALVLMPHRGQAASRNTALELARCGWVFYLDADDVLTPGALASLVAFAAEHPEAGILSACCRDFISPELPAEEAAKLQIKPEPYQRMLSGCTLIKHAVYDLVGPYDESLPSSETAQWMLRAKDAGHEPIYTDAVTMMRRYHLNNFGRRSKKQQLQSYMQIIRQRRAMRADTE